MRLAWTLIIQNGKPGCRDSSLTAAASPPGIISGTVNVADADEETSVMIDFRQEMLCAGAAEPVMVTVKSINIANGGDFEEELPAGNYQLVASTDGKETLTAEVTIDSGEAIQQGFNF